MIARLRNWAEALGDAFWIRPAILVALGVLLGEGTLRLEGSGTLPPPFREGWVYGGGEAGARALLGAVGSSAIGVAGTVFSITVAALSLASGQMGPRLLRNFVRDGGNQVALGIFLGTFAYSLVVLRSVRAVEEGVFVPHLAVTVAVGLALLCVATLVWFVHHVSTGINVETVIEGVHGDLSAAILRLTVEEEPPPAPAPAPDGAPVAHDGRGFVRAVDAEGLADWAAGRDAVLHLRARPGDYLFPGETVADVWSAEAATEARDAVRDALAVGERQAAGEDLEFAVRQLVEVAVRALSPGINDPFTAMGVLDRLGAALCEVAPRHLPDGTVRRDGRPVLTRRMTDYPGLCDAMFTMIRGEAARSPAVLIRLVEVIGRVMGVDRRPDRRAALRRHADLALADGRRSFADRADLAALEERHAALPGPGGRPDDTRRERV